MTDPQLNLVRLELTPSEKLKILAALNERNLHFTELRQLTLANDYETLYEKVRDSG